MARLPEAVIIERDATIFELKKAGKNFRVIGKALGVSESAAYKGYKRHVDRMMRHLAIDYAAELVTDYQRLEALWDSYSPYTRPQKLENPDGGEDLVIPPSPDAAKVCLAIMDKKHKLLKMDEAEVNTGGRGGQGAPPVNPDDETVAERTPEIEARELLKIFHESGIIDDQIFTRLREVANLDDIVDAEVVDDGDDIQSPLEISMAEAPAFVPKFLINIDFKG